MSGWECPKCRRCYAPTVMECAPCNALKTTRLTVYAWHVATTTTTPVITL